MIDAFCTECGALVCPDIDGHIIKATGNILWDADAFPDIELMELLDSLFQSGFTAQQIISHLSQLR